jgi:hypothetical protein
MNTFHGALITGSSALQRDQASYQHLGIQQLREAFPFDSVPGYLIFDRGVNFNQEVTDTVKRGTLIWQQQGKGLHRQRRFTDPFVRVQPRRLL